MFYYNLYTNGGIRYLRIKTRETNGEYKTVWEMSSQLSESLWSIGQVNISGQNIVIEAEKNTIHAGYVAVDEFLIIPGLNKCDIMPGDASPSPPVTPTPTSPPDVCFEPGVCTESTLLWEGHSDTKNECLQLCKEMTNCAWFSYYLELSVCILFSDCGILNQEECPDCVSGQTNCTPQFYCQIPGRCQGIFLHAEHQISEYSCLESCYQEPECHWMTWDASDDTCFFFRNCYFSLEDTCQGCITGERKCYSDFH